MDGVIKIKELSNDNFEHHSKLHYVWCAMRQRCNNENNKDYKYYGQRGIKVCQEWDDYSNFKDWALNNGYKIGLTLDRIDTYGNYTPSNCRWISIQEQQKNRRDCRKITFNGETHTLTDWSRKLNIRRETLRDRLDKSNWTIEMAFTTPIITDNSVKQSYKKKRCKT